MLAQGSPMFGVRQQFTPSPYTIHNYVQPMMRIYADLVYGTIPFPIQYQLASAPADFTQFWSPPPISIGTLVGITSNGVTNGAVEAGPVPAPVMLTESFISPDLFNADFTPFGHVGSQEANLYSQINIRQNLYQGGGLIGTPEYLMLNMGQNYETVPDGTIKLYRRYSKNVLSDLLCRDIPALREEDVEQFKDLSADGPFRHSTTCLRCHASIDQMAYTLRNYRWVTAERTCPSDPKTQGVNTSHVSYYAPLYDTDFEWKSQPSSLFHLMQPRGKIYYRSYSGELVTANVTGLSELGLSLMQTEDLYVCAAKRYFKQFTGIDVMLHDMGDAANADLNRAMTPKDWEYRQFVVKLGLALKNHGSTRQLIKDIMASPYFRSSDYGRTAGTK
jgi:hypothetical protein